MAKFVITVQVIIDGVESELTTIGSISGSSKDYNINEVKDTIRKHYKSIYPTKKIAVKIHTAKPVSDLEFEEARHFFLT